MIVRELLICHDNWAYACSGHLVWCLLWIKERISDYSFLISHGWTMKCPVVILNYISCTHPWFSSKSRIIQYAGINIINPWSSMSLLKVDVNLFYNIEWYLWEMAWQNGWESQLVVFGWDAAHWCMGFSPQSWRCFGWY